MRYKREYNSKLKEYINKKHLTYCIDTMGCQMNENDSLKYMGIMEELGLKQANSNEANIFVFNTCCVRENAENTLFGRLGYLKKRKLTEDDIYIVVVGCMTQQKHILEKIRSSYPFTDIVLGTNSMGQFADKLYEVICNNQKQYEYIEEKNEILEDVPVIRDSKFKASVSIIYGCNNFCTYCIVPYVRGRERSREPQDIINEIRKLASDGYKEIMLLGQNVNSYGKDFKNNRKYTFVDLLSDIEKIDGIEIIRFMSPHPKDFSDELIEKIANSSKIAKQIHLPLQSGNTDILKRMNRKYTKEQYLELVEKIKSKVEQVSFSTDIIVGFPGETEEQFCDTLDIIKRVEYDQIYMFIYSKRVGTPAAKMKDNAVNKEKVERLERLKKVYEAILPKRNSDMIGNSYKVLVEGKSKNNDKLYTGRTSQNKVVIFEGNENIVGNIVNVKIDSEHLWYLKGSIVK